MPDVQVEAQAVIDRLTQEVARLTQRAVIAEAALEAAQRAAEAKPE